MRNVERVRYFIECVNQSKTTFKGILFIGLNNFFFIDKNLSIVVKIEVVNITAALSIWAYF